MTKKKKYKVVYEKDKCIGAATCALAAPDFFAMNDENVAELKGGKEVRPGVFEREIFADELTVNKEAAHVCPVDAIYIVDEEGKRVA